MMGPAVGAERDVVAAAVVAAIDSTSRTPDVRISPKVIWRFMAPKSGFGLRLQPRSTSRRIGARGSDKAAPSSRTADVHHIAIALGCIRIDKSRYQQPTINGNDFAICFSVSRSGWTDIVFPA